METKKLTKKEIDQIKLFNRKYQETFLMLGQVEASITGLEERKDQIKKQYNNIKKQENEMLKDVQDKYGPGRVDADNWVFIPKPVSEE